MKTNHWTWLTILLLFTTAAAFPALGEGTVQPPNDCDRSGTATIVYGAAPALGARCVLIPNGGTVAWVSLDIIPHDPGDGITGQGESRCFQVSETAGQHLRLGDRYQAEFHFNGDDIVLRNVSFNGEQLEQAVVCTPDDTSQDGDPPERDIWVPTSDGNVAVPWFCYQHLEDEQLIVLEQP